MVLPLAPGGDTTGMLVTAADIVDEAHDYARLTPMMEEAEEVTGVRTPMTLADAGYFAGRHLEECHRKGQQVAMPDTARPLDAPYHKDRFIYDKGSDSYICPHGQRLTFVGTKTNKGVPMRLYRVASASVCLACPAFGVCTKEHRRGRALEIGPYDGALRRHREWMSTEAAEEAYDLRKQIVEPVFGIIKDQLGGRKFLLRGLADVKAEWVMLATAFNLRTLWRAWRSRTKSLWTPPESDAGQPFGLSPALVPRQLRHQQFRSAEPPTPTDIPNYREAGLFFAERHLFLRQGHACPPHGIAARSPDRGKSHRSGFMIRQIPTVGAEGCAEGS